MRGLSLNGRVAARVSAIQRRATTPTSRGRLATPATFGDLSARLTRARARVNQSRRRV